MLPRNDPDRIHIAFDDHRLVANAGLILRPLWPIVWDWASWWTATLTSETHPVGPMLAIAYGGTDPGGVCAVRWRLH